MAGFAASRTVSVAFSTGAGASAAFVALSVTCRTGSGEVDGLSDACCDSRAGAWFCAGSFAAGASDAVSRAGSAAGASF